MQPFFCLILFAVAQAAAPSLQFRGPQRPLHAKVQAAPDSLGARAGAKVRLFVDVTPNPNIHVYAPGAKDFIPITIKVEPQANIKIGKVAYPRPETMTFADAKVPVFQKPFRLTQEVTLAGSAKAGTTVPLTATVSFQACDDQVCYPPETAAVVWTLAIQ